MKLIFVGPQGCGKGTQAKVVAERLGLCHVCTGDLLRACEGDLRVEIKLYTDEGRLVPDELIGRILKERISREDCSGGFILDGFPRNLNQVDELAKITDIDKVVEIFISDDEAVRRIVGRRGCSGCGAIYNVNTSPVPLREGVCDKCGGELIVRTDDSEEALRKRLEIYHGETEAVLGRYDSVRVDGMGSIEKVSRAVLEVLGIRV